MIKDFTTKELLQELLRRENKEVMENTSIREIPKVNRFDREVLNEGLPIKNNFYLKASNDLERIMNLPYDPDMSSVVILSTLKSVLIKSGIEFKEKERREFYIHLSTLFLNVILNRRSEFGKIGEERAFVCRDILLLLREKLTDLI